MKILMLGCKEYPYGISSKYEKFPGGGTARYVISLSEELASRGHEVHLIVRLFPGQKKYEKIRGLHIYRVKFLNNKYLRLPSFNTNSYLLAKRLMKKIKFDVIHTHGIFGATIGRLLRKKTATVATLHGIASTQVKANYNKVITFIIKKLQNHTYSKMDTLIFLSEDEKKDYLRIANKKPKQHSIIYPGIKPINIQKNSQSKFTITFIGRLVAMKGLDKFIDSYKYLEHKKNIRYIIVGDGTLRKNLEQKAKSEIVNGEIIFTGYTNNIRKYLSETDIFILPSEGGEGLPCSILEAMSAGIPCMVSNFNTPVKKSAIINLENNMPKTIAKNIEKYYSNRKTLLQIGINAKQEFENNFSIKKYADNYTKTYSETINTNKRRINK